MGMRISRRRKLAGLAVTAAMALILAACGGSTGSGSSTSGGQPKSGAPAPAATSGGTAPAPAPAKSSTDPNKAFTLTISAGRAGALLDTVAQGGAQAIRTAYPKSNIGTEPGSPVSAITNTISGKTQMGVTQFQELAAALQGIEPFKQKESVLTVATLLDQSPFQIWARKDFVEKHGIKTFKDIITKKVPVRLGANQKGNLIELMTRQMIEYYKSSYKDIESWGGQVLFLPIPDVMALVKDNKADLSAGTVAVPYPSVSDTALTTNLVMIPMDKDLVEHMAKLWNMPVGTIPAGGYSFQQQPFETWFSGATLLASKDMSTEDVYLITKALVEHVDVVRKAMKSMDNLTPQALAATHGPYHPGAEKYYKEAGLIK